MEASMNTRLWAAAAARPALLVHAALAVTACASGPKARPAVTDAGAAQPAPAQPATSRGGRPRARTDIILVDTKLRSQWTNVYDLVSNLRPRWLQTRGPDTIMGTPTEVQVHFDDSRLGGIESLRTLPVAGVVSIQFLDANAATARWGLNHGQGAILLSSRRR
jgi:hypothetical protein